MNYVKSTIFSGIFGLVFFLSSQAQAHYMWLNASDYTPKANKNGMFTVGWGHHFYNPAGDILIGRDIVGDLRLVGPDGKTIEVSAVNEAQYKSAETLSRGTYLALVQRKEGFSTKTTEGYKHQSRKGLKNVIHSRYLGMYGKAILNVGETGDGKNITAPMGITLEIIPLDNPSDLNTGDYFRFRLVYQGKGIACPFNATYAGFSTEDAWAYTARTGKNGEGKIKILESGIWVIKANHKAPYPDPKEADEYSYTTSLAFEVK